MEHDFEDAVCAAVDVAARLHGDLAQALSLVTPADEPLQQRLQVLHAVLADVLSEAPERAPDQDPDWFPLTA